MHYRLKRRAVLAGIKRAFGREQVGKAASGWTSCVESSNSSTEPAFAIAAIMHRF